ncbi:hypothetical protein Mapa_014436 [Marchantia paleacea]|nr:hypothetical protein Mapa_014436 [Marchantia paleacea]
MLMDILDMPGLLESRLEFLQVGENSSSGTFLVRHRFVGATTCRRSSPMLKSKNRGWGSLRCGAFSIPALGKKQ